MEPATSLSLGYGRTALLRGMVGPPARLTMKTRTMLHYSSTFHGRQYSSRSCHDLRMVPIVRAKVDEDERRWVEKAGVASSVVLACVVGMMSLGLSSNGRAMSAVNQALAIAPGSGPVPASETIGGLDARSAIASLMEVSKFLSTGGEGTLLNSRHLADWLHKMPTIDLNKGPDREQIGEIKKKAMLKLKKGDRTEAEKLLKDEYNKWKGMGGEVKLNMEMAIVEILIAQGKYVEASGYDCIKEEISSGPSDPRIPLYKAIISTATMDRDVETVKKLWDKFKDTLDAERGRERPG